MAYDSGNIFAKILRGEIPCKKVYEDDHVLAFYDIAPKAPVHVLVIPRGAYVSHDDFSANATEAEIVGLTRAAGKITRDLGLAAPGYRLIANTGANGGQEVPHYHVHILGGAYVGPMVNRR
jgi:diadenosine tetraphosphate (Ap4A) HIT family hydrolase